MSKTLTIHPSAQVDPDENADSGWKTLAHKLLLSFTGVPKDLFFDLHVLELPNLPKHLGKTKIMVELPKMPLPPFPTSFMEGMRTYLLNVRGEDESRVLESMAPMLGKLLQERTVAIREQKLEEMVEFMTGQMVAPTPEDTKMAQLLASRRARALMEFGYFTAEQLAEQNQSQATNRSAMANNWKKRSQVFSVSHRDETGRTQEVFPGFQFQDGKPIKTIQSVLETFGARKTPWKIVLWFTSNNGWLPEQARPVDLLESNPEAVLQAARREAAGSAV